MSLPRSASPQWATPLLIGSVLGLPLVLGTGSLRGAALAMAAVVGVIGLLVLALSGAGRVADLLLLTFTGLVFIPVDKYLLYRDHVGGWPGIRVSAADIPLLLLVPVLLLGMVLGRAGNRVPRWVLVVYGLLVLQYALSAAGATYPELSAFEIVAALRALAIAVVVAALVRVRHLDALLTIVALVIVLHSVFGIVQAATGRPVGATWLGGPETLMQEELLTGSVRVRPAGLLTHPVIYATLFVVTLPVLVAGALSARRPGLSTLLIGGLVIGSVGLALTLSRGAWISTAFALIVLVAAAARRGLLRRRTLRRLALAAAGVGIVATAFAPLAWERLTASQSGNLDVRFELNQIALRMVRAHPMTGVGVNNFLPVMEAYDPEDVAEYFPATVHNVYLLEASEAGLPALVLFGLLLVGIPVLGLRSTRHMTDPRITWLVLGVSAGLLGFALTQVADFSHRLEPLRSIVWCHIGLLFALIAQERRRSAVPPRALEEA